MQLKVIKTEADYDEAIEIVKGLMSKDLNSEESNKLEVISALVESYEQKHYQIDMPDPIAAIKFIMDQRGLKQKDLVKYIGSASKVSELLSGSRPLSLKMIRSLHKNLKIPAEILLQDYNEKLPEETEIEWSKFPLPEINKRGWFKDIIEGVYQLKEYAEDSLRPMLESLNAECCKPLLPRTSAKRFRTDREIDVYALTIWQARVVQRATKITIDPFFSEALNTDFMRQLVKLSVLENGPLVVRDLLNKNGIHLIIEEHFNHTYLDGAALLLNNGKPVIALTLRHDRLDNFWFTLMHEISHIMLHLGADKSPIFDDLDPRNKNISDIEVEADKMAQDVLIPPECWDKEKSFLNVKKLNTDSINLIAKSIGVHKSIIAGRIRHDTQFYRKLSQFVGMGIPKKLFGLCPN